VDDRGRYAAIESGGPAFEAARVFDRNPETHHPELYVLDPPGFGDSRPLVTPYQAAPWGSMDRIASYFSYGNADSALSIASRAVATVIDTVAERTGKTDRSIVVVGAGLGGVVATLAAAVATTDCSVCLVDSLASFQHLLDEEHYAWPAVSFLGNALLHFDLHEILRDLNEKRELLVINPRDGRRELLTPEAAASVFGEVAVRTSADEAEVNRLIGQFADRCS
jgi:pimeloyl-ACP methyl ester carboxylesterase